MNRQTGLPTKPSLIIQAPVSVGELLDKITILEIKLQRITDKEKISNVEKEHAALKAIEKNAIHLNDETLRLVEELRAVNSCLWDVEDAIREHETRQDFGESFIKLARSVYKNNDQRAALKKTINALTGSGLIEEKSYNEGSQAG